MLLSGTFMLFALTRSTSSQSCGTLARKVVRLSGEAGRLIRLHHHGESLRLQLLEPGVAAILNEKAIAARVADARDRRRRKDSRRTPRESRRERAR